MENVLLSYLGGSSLSPHDGLGPAATVLQIGDYLIGVDYGLEFIPNGYGYPKHQTLNGHKINKLILTHSHADHVGSLFIGEDLGVFEDDMKILASPQTHAITSIVLDQSWSRFGQNVVLDQTLRQVAKDYYSLNKIEARQRVLPLGEVELAPGIKAFVGYAGHIRGALYIIIRTPKGKNICFLGDHAWHKQDTVEASEFPDDVPNEWLPDIMAQIDLTNPSLTSLDYNLVMSNFADHVKKCLDKKKVVVVLAFMNGRAQNAALGLRRHGVEPVYCDGGGVKVFEILKAAKWSPKDKDFSLKGIKMITGGIAQRQELYARGGPLVIVTPSGMGDGGPVIDWFKMGLENPNFEFVGVSWTAPGSSMTKLTEKARRRDSQKRAVYLKITDDRFPENQDWDLPEKNYYKILCGVSRFHLSGHGGLGEQKLALEKIVKRRGRPLDLIVTTHGTQPSKRLCRSILGHLTQGLIAGNVGTQIPL